MPQSPPIIFATILAAGRASRFGSTKQTARYAGEPLARRAAAAARRAFGDRVLNVLGHDVAAVLRSLGSDGGFAIVNDNFEQGLGSSIACAARSCRKHADALVVVLADQPLVTAAHLRELAETWSGADDRIVATAFDDARGPPVLFPRKAFDELADLTGDRGAHSLLRDSRFDLRSIRFEPAAVDIDSPADLEAIS